MHTLGLGFIGVGLCGCVRHRRVAGRAGGARVQREESKPLSRLDPQSFLFATGL